MLCVAFGLKYIIGTKGFETIEITNKESADSRFGVFMFLRLIRKICVFVRGLTKQVVCLFEDCLSPYYEGNS